MSDPVMLIVRRSEIKDELKGVWLMKYADLWPLFQDLGTTTGLVSPNLEKAALWWLRKWLPRGWYPLPDQELQKEANAWLRDPQNDCLRARGDIRWEAVNRLEGYLR